MQASYDRWREVQGRQDGNEDAASDEHFSWMDSWHEMD